MRYQRAYQYFFTNPNWVANLLGGAGCMAVPVFGWAAFAGYVLEVVESINDTDDEDVHYPTFDLNLMGQYVKRGLGPLLVQLILLTPVIFLVALGLIVAALTLGAKPATPTFPMPAPERDESFFLTVSTLLAVGVLALTVILSVVMAPMALYVGLRQELALAAAFQFVPEFARRVGKELLLAEIFILVTGLSLLVFGVAACCIGVFPAAAWAGFAQNHLMAQLYGLYLERGGTPIELAEDEA